MKIKNIISVILVSAVLLTGCANDPQDDPATEQGTQQQETGQQGAEVNADPSDVVKAVLSEVPIESSVEKGKDDLENYYSGLDVSTVESAAFALCGSGALPDELTVIKCSSADDAKTALTALNSHLEKQKELFSTYTPDEMYKLEGAAVYASGNYAVYIALSDNEKAKSVVDGKLS